MDFCEEFALIQGSLISVQKSVGQLQCLSSQKGDDGKISIVVDTLKKIIADRGIQPGKELDIKEDCSLRRIHMFLVLNTNLDIQEELLDDINCGHIVDCAPSLSKDLLVELVWRLFLHKYMCETIVFCPLSFSAELLDVVLNKLSSLEPFQALQRIEDLCNAIFCKYVQYDLLQEANKMHIKSKLFTYFKKLVQYFVKPDFKEMNRYKLHELYHFAGCAMKCVLCLLTNCLKLYLNPVEQKVDIPEVYDISLPEIFDADESLTFCLVLDNFVNELLSACKVNFCAITVDVWLFWADVDVEPSGNRTLQNVIRETMYCCSEELKKAQGREAEFPLAAELISMLSTSAVKPRDEDDEIEEADIQSIVKNVSNKSKSQKKWFRALLRLSEVMTNESCTDCLRNNLHLAEYEDVKIILEKTVAILSTDLGDKQCDKVRQIGLHSLKHLSLDKQIEIVQWYFKTFGINGNLMTDNFLVMVTESFNKAVNVTEKKDKLLSEFVCLCMQSPIEVITKVLHEALLNSKHILLMVEILECLNPICNVCEVDDVTVILPGNEKLTTVTHLLNNIMKNDLSELEKSNFVKFVVALVTHNIVCSSTFLKRCLLPALYNSLIRRNWTDLLLWLEVLHSFTDERVKWNIDIPLCPLLVMLAQVLELSRWNLLSFSISAVSVCEEALIVVRRVVKMVLDMKTTEDKEVKWLQIKLEFLSPLNKSYFSKLWTKFDKEWISSPNNMDVFLLDMMQSNGSCDIINTKAAKLFNNAENKESVFLFSFSKLLPLCTATEWKILAQRMKEINVFTDKTEKTVQQIHLFADSVLILLLVINKEDNEAHECVLSCLDYSCRNLGLVLKEEMIPCLKYLPVEEQVKVFIKMLHVLGRLPSSVKESCSVLIVNILVEFFPEILKDSTQEIEDNSHFAISRASLVHDIVTNIRILGNGEALQVLARKLLEFVL